MEKDDVANLIVKKSDRIMFKTHKDKSEAWKWFVKILIDNKVCDFMKCKLELADEMFFRFEMFPNNIYRGKLFPLEVAKSPLFPI